NFSWLNFLTMTLAFAAVDGSVFGWLLGVDRPHALGTGGAGYEAAVIALTVLVAVLSYWPARNLVSGRQLMNFSFNPYHLVNTYGAFGSITRERYEVVIEGTTDVQDSPTTTWAEYEFKGKPGDPARRPRQVAPYHLRLDWLMWFAALSPAYAGAWLGPFVEK